MIKSLIFKTLIKIWTYLPIKNMVKKIIKSNQKFKDKLYQDLRYKGIMKINISKNNFQLFNPGNTTIENEIYWHGILGWEKTSMELWIELSKESSTILDIGANSGVYSITAGAANPQSEIYAFEPVKRTAEIFKRNIDLNPNFKINLVEKAVSNKNGKCTFYDVPSETQYSASLNPNMLASLENHISYEVETVKLDDLSELIDKKIDLIKLDVEMHEPEAIEGMIELIRKNKPTILVEILTDEIADKIRFIFSEFDYLCFSIDEESKPKLLSSISKSEFHNILLIYKDKAESISQYLSM
jgi:FkbM family methyltransferase